MLVVGVAWATGLAGPATVRADALDVALMDHIEQIRDDLVERRYEAAGVLAFRVQLGKALPTFDGGIIVNSLAQRLETALIVSLQEDKHRLLVVRNASASAGAALGAANYRTEADRRRLFDVDYRQAWGNPPPKVKADVFLAGKVVVSDDLRKLAVVVECFDRRDPGVVRDVVTFEAPVDRQMLADLGQGFSLSIANPRGLLRAVTEDDVFDAIQKAKAPKPTVPEVATTTEPKTAVPTTAQPPKPAKTTPVENVSSSTVIPKAVSVVAYYDDVAQTMTLDGRRGGNANFVLPTPREGQSLSIGVANLTDEKIGLVVTVNGVSTLYEQKGTPAALKKWILEPGVDYRIKGIYQNDGTTYKTIRSLSERASTEHFADLGGDEAAGLIQVHVFRPVPPAQITSITTTPSIRLLSDAELAEHKPGTLAELQSLIVPGKFNRGLFSWNDKRTETLQKSSLGPVQLTDSIVIRYYSKSAVK